MAKTTNIYVRVEPELKEQVEIVLEQLGIPISNAINIFLKQVVMQRGIPFDVKLPTSKPLEMAALPEAEVNQELDKGYLDFIQGKTKPATQIFSDIRKDFDL